MMTMIGTMTMTTMMECTSKVSKETTKQFYHFHFHACCCIILFQTEGQSDAGPQLLSSHCLSFLVLLYLLFSLYSITIDDGIFLLYPFIVIFRIGLMRRYASAASISKRGSIRCGAILAAVSSYKQATNVGHACCCILFRRRIALFQYLRK